MSRRADQATILGDPTCWTDRERAFFANGWNECLKMQPGENERLRTALKVADESIRHHLRSEKIDAAMIQPHAVKAIRDALGTDQQESAVTGETK